MKHLITITILLLLSSCVTEKQRAKICSGCPIVIKDSIHEVTIVTPFDTTLFISKIGKDIILPDLENGNCCQMVDSLYAMMTRGNGTITVNNEGIKSSIFKKDKKIVFRCEADSLKEVIRLLKTTTTTNRSRVITVPARCEKEHKDWLDKYDRPWFFISLGAFLLLIGWKLFTMKARLLKLFTKLTLK